MIRYIISLIIAATFFTSASASEGEALVQVLALTHTDGKVQYFELDAHPISTFQDGHLVVLYQGTELHFPLSDIKNYTFTYHMSGVEQINADTANNITLIDKTLTISGGIDGTVVEIYSIDGSLAASASINTEASTQISVAHLSAGVYLVRLGSSNFKFVKR